MKKKMMLSLAAVAMVGTLAVGGTLAWFTDTETATNIVTTGNVDVKITETLPENPVGYTVSRNVDGEGITYGGIEPGTVIDKEPVISYKGDSDAYVRYKIEFTAKKGDEALAIGDGVTFLKDEKEVTPYVNGYVYSTQIYQKNDTVAIPFDQIKFAPEFGNELAGAEIEIKIVADAIQADNLSKTGETITQADLAREFGDNVAQYVDDVAVAETTAAVVE